MQDSLLSPYLGENPHCADENLRRMQWRCRRGMLEMDLLLSRFMEIYYTQLNDNEKIAFNLILDYPDNALWSWIVEAGNEQNQPINSKNADSVLAMLRHCYPPQER